MIFDKTRNDEVKVTKKELQVIMSQGWKVELNGIKMPVIIMSFKTKSYGATRKPATWELDEPGEISKIVGRITLRLETPETIEMKKQEEIERKKNEEKQTSLAAMYKETFAYQETVPNSLTENKYRIGIDEANGIRKIKWVGSCSCPLYQKLSPEAVKRERKIYNEIK